MPEASEASAEELPAVERDNEENEEEEAGEPSMRKKTVALLILLLLNLLNYIDRFTIVGIMDRLKIYYGMNDKDSGLLQTVFIVAFMLFAPVFGYFGDRYNRKMLIIVGIFIWILAVLMSSFCLRNHFYLFMLCRGIVGIGEASYTTLAPTILSDLYKGASRSRVYMIFYFAIPVGSGLGFILGSKIAYLTDSWQWGVRFSPIVGTLSLILMFFFLDEPVRGANEGAREMRDDQTIWEDLKYFAGVKTYVYATVASIASFFTTGTLSWWVPQLIGYAYLEIHRVPVLPGEESVKINLIFGIITCLAGLIGVLIGSLWANFWQEGKCCFSSCKSQNADLYVCTFSMFFALPFVFGGVVVVEYNIEWGYFFFYFGTMSICMSMAINVDILMAVIVPNRRSLAVAVQTLLAHCFGDATSPYIIGVMSDSLRGGSESPYGHFFALQKSLYISVFMLVVGGAMYLTASFYSKRDRKDTLYLMNATDDWPEEVVSTDDSILVANEMREEGTAV